MTPQLERRAVAFIRTVANRCCSCMHRSEENCRNCTSSWANEIMSEYERDAKVAIKQETDYSLQARRVRILDILRAAGRPLLAADIDISDIASTSLKEWTLRRMLRVGQIARVPNDDREDRRRIYRYFIPENPNTNSRSKSK